MRVTLIILCFCAMLPVLYFASVGPVVWLHRRNMLPRKPVEAVYSPVDSLHNNDQLPQWYVDYVDWFAYR